MKYSLLMPYYMRSKLLLNTIVSFLHHYGSRSDFEVVIIDDPKNSDEERIVLYSLPPFVKVINSPFTSLNPAQAFNLGASIANGEFLILTNPECFHQTDILAGLDRYFSTNRRQYIVCACLNVHEYQFGIKDFKEFKYTPLDWYQHTIHNNRLLHFCSALPKDLFLSVGGFDEEYKDGVCYEDADFREKLIKLGTTMTPDDSLIVIHLAHSRDYQNEDASLVAKNKSIYVKKWCKES